MLALEFYDAAASQRGRGGCGSMLREEEAYHGEQIREIGRIDWGSGVERQLLREDDRAQHTEYAG